MKKIKFIFTVLIIRWALKKLVKILEEKPNISYGGLEKLGIEDFSYNDRFKQYSIWLSKSVSEKK